MNLYTYCHNNPVLLSDPSGHYSGVDDLIAGTIGAVAGLAGQLAGDIITSCITGEVYFSDWQTYTGAAIGGFVGGVATLYVGPVASAAIASGVSTYFGETLQYYTNAENAPEIYLDILDDTAKSALTGAVFSKIPLLSSKQPSVYFASQAYGAGQNALQTLGRNLQNSASQTFQVVNSNLIWDDAAKSTMANGLISEVTASVEGSVYETMWERFKIWLNTPVFQD